MGTLRVLGIDPGSRVCGWGLVERRDASIALRGSGTIRPPGSVAFAQRLRHLHEEARAVIARTAPDSIAIESVFHSRHARAALQLGHARGVLLLAAALADVPVFEYAPAAVKKALTGQGSATKEQVRTMVGILLGAPFEGAIDTSDALAIALHHAQAGLLSARLAGTRQATAATAGSGPRLRKVKG